MRRFLFLTLLLIGLCLNAPRLLSEEAKGQPARLRINEIMAANQTGLADEDGAYSDWIELYNPGSRPVNLAGWALTDDPAEPEKWTFPDITLEGQGYLVVFASGKDRKPAGPDSELHTNFKLNKAGEFLGLYHLFDQQFIDTVSAPAGEGGPAQFADIPYGRYVVGEAEEAYAYLATATPGSPNETAPLWLDVVSEIRFSLERGFYEAPITLALATETPGATIRYTTDGSEPSESHGELYTGPLSLNHTTYLRAAAFKPGFRPSPVTTQSYIFLDDVLAQTQAPPGYPRSWGAFEGAPVAADYGMDPEVVNDPHYGGKLKAALTSLPSLSLVTDLKSFYDLYANPQRRGQAWERPVSVELIEPAGAGEGFQINAGMRMQGTLGRSEIIPKHGFRLFFREEYGAGRLAYPLFPGSAVQSFDTLVLRAGVNRSYAGYPKGDPKETTYTRDEWLRASQRAMSGFGARGVFVHLYLNGLYWGLYNVVERPDAAFMADHFGGAEEEWGTLNHGDPQDQAPERFKTLHRLAAEGNLADPDKYEAIGAYLDIPHFIDYLILNWYAGNLDWGFNNWYAGVREPAGQVRYFVWDGERTWYQGAEIYMEFDEYRGQPNLVRPLLEALMENPDFRITFADRIYKHLFNEGALTEANSKARWLELNKLIEQAIIGESARWGDTWVEPVITQADWFKARDEVLDQMEGNVDLFINLAREGGYYPPIDPPVLEQAAGQTASHIQVSLDLPEAGAGGQIYYTTDGSDPRLAGSGGIAPTAQLYTAPLAVTGPLHLKARVFDSKLAQGPWQGWSALHEASLNPAAGEGKIRITEIMYNPEGGDDYEFIELKNTGNTPFDLAGFSFEGISFAFPPVFPSLPPGEAIVLVRNPATFAQRYPEVPIGGIYQGQLSNKGEEISLRDNAGQVVTSFIYDDENGWPLSADGRGDSLVLAHETGDPNRPESWRASGYANGSPGVDEGE